MNHAAWIFPRRLRSCLLFRHMAAPSCGRARATRRPVGCPLQRGAPRGGCDRTRRSGAAPPPSVARSRRFSPPRHRRRRIAGVVQLRECGHRPAATPRGAPTPHVCVRYARGVPRRAPPGAAPAGKRVATTVRGAEPAAGRCPDNGGWFGCRKPGGGAGASCRQARVHARPAGARTRAPSGQRV